MTIEVLQPELEALIQQRMATGRFHNVEDVLLYALRSTENGGSPGSEPHLVDVLAQARALLDGEELDLSRKPSPGRPVDQGSFPIVFYR